MTAPHVSIQDVAELNPRKLPTKLSADTLVSFVPMSAVSEHDVSIVGAEYRPYGEVQRGYTPFARGDILIAKITPCFENGKMAHALELPCDIGFGSTEFHVLRPSRDVEGRYLFHLLREPYVRRAGQTKMKGAAGQRRVPAEFLATLRIPLPPLAEQKRIARILDEADALRAKRRESIEQLDALVQSVFLDMFGDPVTNPKGWDRGSIGDLLEAANYGNSKKASPDQGEFPILRMNNITYTGEWDFTSLKYIDLSPKEQKKHLVHKGQILFNRTNSKELVGKTAVFREAAPMAFAGYLVRGIVNELADAEYIGAFMNTPQAKAYLQSKCKNIVGMANINAKEFQAIPIPIPPVDLQRNYAVVVKAAHQNKRALREYLAELDTLFASLQSRAFNGQL